MSNPFANKGLIITNRYIKRAKALKTLNRRVLDNSFGNLSVFGERNVGKSTFVWNSIMFNEDDLVRNNIIPVWYKLDELNTHTEFIYTLISKIKLKIAEKKPSISLNSNLFLDLNIILNAHEAVIKQELNNFFAELCQLEIKIILIFDEFDAVSGYLDKNDFYILKNISTYPDYSVAIIAISKKTIKEIQPKDDLISNFNDTFHPYEMCVYSEEEFIEYYRYVSQSLDNVNGILKISSEEKEKVYNLIIDKKKFNPFLLDCIFFYAIEKMEENHSNSFYDSVLEYCCKINKPNKLSNHQVIKNMKSEIFISYAWGDDLEENESREAIVNLIQSVLTERGFKFNIDKKDLNYRDNISKFEESIGKGDYIILVISDKFLKSKHCMNEALQIQKNGNIYKRIFPIVLKDALIYKEENRIDYLIFWDNEIEKLQSKIKEIKNSIAISEVVNTITLYSDIRRFFDEITALLKNMNTLTPEMHKESNFSQLIEAIEKQHQEDIQNSSNTAKGNLSERTTNQYGSKSIYIEKNNGNITIN